MTFTKFMATFTGRGVRIGLGILLIAVGLLAVQDTAGIILAVVGVIPIVAGVFNICLVAPILGAPFSGRTALES